jgi:hypothetical protein
MFGENSSLSDYNSFLRTHGYRLKKPRWGSRGILLQEATIRLYSKNYAWVDKKVFYDLQDVILFANHLLLETLQLCHEK